MKKRIRIERSGISLVDNTWGGFYRGGSYLVIGPRKSGRTLLGLQYAMECARQKEVCLYFTSMRPKDLMIQAASIDLDLQNYMNQNLIIVVRVAPPADVQNMESPDDFLVEYFNDIVTVVDQYKPSKIVFDELTPFVGFNSVDLLYDVFNDTCEKIEDEGITSLFILGEPATPPAQLVVDALTENTTALIRLKKEPRDAGIQGGQITITPNVGHTEGKFSTDYTIEPYKGVTTEYNLREEYVTKQKVTEEKGKDKYTTLSEIDIPEEDFTFTNLYNINDFTLILNNQIALFKSTGQIFTVVSFRLDSAAQEDNLLTISQLKNAIRLSTDRKDKLCVIENKIIILISREDEKAVSKLIAKVRNNLPSEDPQYLRDVLKYISVYAIKVDENIQNAEDLLEELASEEQPKNNYRFS